jgi:hypothetical protein
VFDKAHIRQSLESKFQKYRKDTLLYVVSVILLTPFLLILALAALLFAVMYSVPGILDDFTFIDDTVTVANVALVTLSLSSISGRRGPWKDALGWFGAGFGIVLGLLAMSYGTELSTSNPQVFWSLYGLGFFLTLAFLGHVYSPRDNYYLGWMNGYMDDPFTFRDDFDRAHMSLGFALAIPRMIFEAYGHVFGSLWLWQAPDGGTWETAARVLLKLGEDDQRGAQKMLKALGSKNAILVMTILTAMKLVKNRDKGMALTIAGSGLVGY